MPGEGRGFKAHRATLLTFSPLQSGESRQLLALVPQNLEKKCDAAAAGTQSPMQHRVRQAPAGSFNNGPYLSN